MGLRLQRSMLDSFLRRSGEVEDATTTLDDGSRVAVVGGGPAGSFFSYFLLKMAEAIDLDVAVDIFEPRFFSRGGPSGCNHCGGIVSESLVQVLATEGINLPAEVVQRGIDAYVVHMDIGSVAIQSPAGEARIAALYRGNGPRDGGELQWDSFDGYLQGMARRQGAEIRHKLVTHVEWEDGKPVLEEHDGHRSAYDLVAVSAGVNSNFIELLQEGPAGIAPPKTTRTYICEFKVGRDGVQELMGNAMHVFLLSIPRLEFAALIPKGEFVTMVMLGEELDQELINAFLDDPVVQRCFPTREKPIVCGCSPLINVGVTKRPYGDRIVMIGDSGVTRLYKDGIGAAYRTAKAAASTAVFQGVSAADFEKGYWPACRAISSDNAIGKLLFGITTLFKHSKMSRRAILRMTSLEQRVDGRTPHMSSVLWNMFTGSAPYREIFASTLHPGFIGNLMLNFALGSLPAAAHGKGG